MKVNDKQTSTGMCMTDDNRPSAAEHRSLVDHLLADPEVTHRPRILLVAFEGWNDAGEAATDAVEEVGRQLDAQQVSVLNADEYYDYQVNRPVVTRLADGRSDIAWPQTRLLQCQSPDTPADLFLMLGVEPNFRWKSFTAELLTTAAEHRIDAIVLVGALLSDTPHSRPLSPTLTSGDDSVRTAVGARAPSYEGPTGIVGVISATAEKVGTTTVAMWAPVPHYVAQSPSPKAQLALLKELEQLVDVRLNLQERADDAAAWERGVNELADEDPEIADYIRRLEQARDTEELPEASGESIAREFERYLKRRDQG